MIFVPFCDLSYAALRETRLIYLVRGVVSGRDSALDGAGNVHRCLWLPLMISTDGTEMAPNF